MKRICAICLLVLLCQYAQAQFSVGVNVGANLPAAGVALPGFVQIEQDGTQKALVATLGAGLNYNLQLGYEFNDNLVFNLDAGRFSGFEGGFYQYLNLSGNSALETRVDNSFKGTFTSISPSLVIQASPNTIRPYARFGVLVGWAKVKSTTQFQGRTGEYTVEWSGGTSLGLLGGIGLRKDISEKASLFFELNVRTITAYPKQLENLENFGEPTLPTVNYRESLGPNAPATEALTFAIPMSSFGLSVGFSYKL